MKQSFSYFKGYVDTEPKPIELSQIVKLIASDPLISECTSKYRYYRQMHQNTSADFIKHSCPCFAVSVTFSGGKQAEHIVGWTQVGLVDLDKIEFDQVETAVSAICKDPHTLLCYVTISGRGIRILYRYQTLKEVPNLSPKALHSEAFRQANAYYERLTGLKSDAQCKNCTRLSGLAHDDKVYYQPHCTPFVIQTDSPTVKGSTRKRTRSTVRLKDVVAAIRSQLQSEQVVYQSGRHNEYIMRTGYLLNQYGIPLEEATEWAVESFQDYQGNIPAILKSCYQKQDEFGTLQLPAAEEKRSSYATVEEIEAFLQHKAQFRFNVITHRNEICHDHAGSHFQPLNDRDEGTLWRKISKELKPTRIGDLRMVLSSDFIPEFDPFLDYFKRLPAWKPGDPDYLSQLADTVRLSDSSAEAHDTFSRCLRKWMVAMVAGFLSDRVNHEILVFVGRQGIYKTTWFEYLLPPELRNYFAPKGNSRHLTKDDRLLLAECGLICLEEIVNMTDEELEQIKGIVTLPQVVERAAYARNKEVRTHIASFCGTGNQQQFLTDLSGNRRWLPFEVDNILSPFDHELPYTGIYSQIYYLWQNGFKYWFSTEEINQLSQHLHEFEATSLEEELISTHFRQPQPGETGVFMTNAEILVIINGAIRQPLSAIKVGIIMKKMGYTSIRKNGLRGYRVVRLKVSY